jgi:hypothetical protein
MRKRPAIIAGLITTAAVLLTGCYPPGASSGPAHWIDEWPLCIHGWTMGNCASFQTHPAKRGHPTKRGDIVSAKWNPSTKRCDLVLQETWPQRPKVELTGSIGGTAANCHGTRYVFYSNGAIRLK